MQPNGQLSMEALPLSVGHAIPALGSKSSAHTPPSPQVLPPTGWPGRIFIREQLVP